MRIIIFDEFHTFKEKELEKLASIGIKEILTFDLWIENEPILGKYNFDRIIRYEQICNRLGIKVLIMGPYIPPFWVPKDWFLKNAFGIGSDFSHEADADINNLLNKIKYGEKIEFNIVFLMSWRFFSYWNPKAENCIRNYAREVQKVLKSEYISCIGNFGECFFPAIALFKKDNKYSSPWWYDGYAEKSWKKSRLTREEWFHKEFLRITRERLGLYKTKWLQYLPSNYFSQDITKILGNVAVEEALEENKDGLNRILFTVFTNTNFQKIAAKQAKKYKVFAGAEGCRNVLPNYLKAEKIGLEGLICNPCLPMCYEPIKKWQYLVLKIAVSMNKKGLVGIGGRVLGYLLMPCLGFLSFIQERDKYIGRMGILLKRFFPGIYNLIKN